MCGAWGMWWQRTNVGMVMVMVVISLEDIYRRWAVLGTSAGALPRPRMVTIHNIPHCGRRPIR